MSAPRAARAAQASASAASAGPSRPAAPGAAESQSLPVLERAAQAAASALRGASDTARVTALCAALAPRRMLLVGADSAPDVADLTAAMGAHLELLVWLDGNAARARQVLTQLEAAEPAPQAAPEVHVYHAAFCAAPGTAPHPVAVPALAELLRGPGFDLIALEPAADRAAFHLEAAQIAALLAPAGVLLVAPLERSPDAVAVLRDLTAEGFGRSVLWAAAPALPPAALVAALPRRHNHGASRALRSHLEAEDAELRDALAADDGARVCGRLAAWLAQHLATATPDLALPLAALPPALSAVDVLDLCSRGEGGVSPLGAAVTLAMLARAFDFPSTVLQFGTSPGDAHAVALVGLADGRLLLLDPLSGWLPHIAGRPATWPELCALARCGELAKLDPPRVAVQRRVHVASLASALRTSEGAAGGDDAVAADAECLTALEARRVRGALGTLRAGLGAPRAALVRSPRAPLSLANVHRILGPLPLTGNAAVDESIARAIGTGKDEGPNVERPATTGAQPETPQPAAPAAALPAAAAEGERPAAASAAPAGRALRFAFFHTENALEPHGIQGGAESALLSLTRALVTAGHEVSVVGRLARDEVVDGVRFLCAGRPGDYDIAAGLARIAAHCDVLVSTMRGDVLLASRGEARLRARILWSHTTILEALHAPLADVAEVADAVLAVSQHQAAALIRAGAPAERVHVMANGIDPHCFRPRSEIERVPDRVLFAGAIVYDKGLDLLIDAMPRVRALVPQAELVVCGAARQWGREPYFDQDEVARALPYVHFRGALAPAELARELCAAALCVVPTPPERYCEAFGLASIEAQACGAPVIVARNGGLVETLRDGETGWIVSPCTRDALAAAVVAALRDRERLAQIGAAAASWAHGAFSWRRNAATMAGLAAELVGAESARVAAPGTGRTAAAATTAPPPGATAAGAATASAAPIGLLTTWRQACGLARYAGMLVQGFTPRSVVILAEACGAAEGGGEPAQRVAASPADGGSAASETPGDAPESVVAVERVWRRGAPLTGVLEAVERNGVRLLHVNHHGSLFGAQLSPLLTALAARGVRSIVTLHAPNQLDPEIAAIGRAAARLLVHGEGSRLEVIANGVDPGKVSVVAQGFPPLAEGDASALRADMGLAPGENLLVTPGFVQPHKGLHEVIRAVAALRGRLPLQYLVLGAPMPGDASGEAYLAQCLAEATRLGVRDRVTVAGGYVSEASLAAYLRAADAVVLPYLSTWWESSATARDAIASGRPVITSGALAFFDLGGAVFRTSAGFPLERAIELVLTQPGLAAALAAEAREIAARDAWPHVAERYRATYAEVLACAEPTEPLSPITAATPPRVALWQASSDDRPDVKHSPPALRVRILLREHASRTGGGDFVLARTIRDAIDPHRAAIALVEGADPPADCELAHLFNFATFDLTRRLAAACVARGLPFVVSALYEDWPSFKLASEERVQAARARLGLRQSVDLAAFARMHEREQQALRDVGRFVAAHARAVVASGASEAERLARDFPGIRTRTVPTAVPPRAGGDRDAFIAEFGSRDFVLCVGRIEPRKNQLALLEALADSPLDLVFATGGTAYRSDYLEVCQKTRRRGRTLYLPALGEAQLAGAYRAARVHVLPSWFELPGLVTLEALRAGCAVVAADRGTLRDHLGDSIPYAPPDDPSALRRAIEEADGWSYGEARQRVAALTVERQAELWAALYAEAVQPASSARPVSAARVAAPPAEAARGPTEAVAAISTG